MAVKERAGLVMMINGQNGSGRRRKPRLIPRAIVVRTQRYKAHDEENKSRGRLRPHSRNQLSRTKLPIVTRFQKYLPVVTQGDQL